MARRRDGREVELITADVDAETIEALRKVLHRLVDDRGRGARLDRRADRDRPRAVGRLEAAPLRQPGPLERRGRTTTGGSLGLAAEDVPEPPKDVVLCESIRRFKGLERPVIVLLEVPRDDPERLDRLLYIGASRATQHLVVIAPLAVLRRLTTLSS